MTRTARKTIVGVAAMAALALGGSAIAGAATSTSSSASTSPTQTAQRPPAFNGPAHGTAAHEDAEKAVTGANADKAKAAAITAAGGGTAGDVTTDFTQQGYEVTVTKTDGTKVEIHLDSSFNALQGGPGGHGAPQGPPPPGAPAPSSSQAG
jgi:hypothetical protein